MSVAVPIVDTWDGPNRIIYLKQGVSNVYPIEDIYHEYRYARRTDENLRKYNPLILAAGNVSKGGGKFTPRYLVLLEGTKIIPFDENNTIYQLGEILTDNPDVDPSVYDLSGFVHPTQIFITPSEAEIILVDPDIAIDPDVIATAVWDADPTTYATISNTFGYLVNKKLMKLKHYLGLK